MENWQTALEKIRGAPDSWVDDALTALGNKFMGLKIKVENGELANSARL